MAPNSSLIARLHKIHTQDPTTWSDREHLLVHPRRMEKVVSHRIRHQKNEFLVRWKSLTPIYVYSWHNISELHFCLAMLQDYTDQSGLMVANNADNASKIDMFDRREVYNGKIWREGHWIKAAAHDMAVEMAFEPGHDMRREAAVTPILRDVYCAIRLQFMENLKSLPGLSIENNIDASTPSLRLRFKSQNSISNAAEELLAVAYNPRDKEISGCSESCGQGESCRHTQQCSCHISGHMVNSLINTERMSGYDQAPDDGEISSGSHPNIRGISKRWPYSPASGTVVATLRPGILSSREIVQECSERCRCGPNCRNRRVQNGRKVPLTIFKTQDRGWGVYANEDLVRGEFVDRYVGEVVTEEEIEEQEVTDPNHSYVFTLDKFINENGGPIKGECLNIDSTTAGNATRFINHSCDPNLTLVCVMYSKHDKLLYDLALFAWEDIPKGTELTFDYKDRDEVDTLPVVKARRRAALQDPANKDELHCLCGSPWCRGLTWA